MLWNVIKEHLAQYPDAFLQEGERRIRYDRLIAAAEDCAKHLNQRKYGILCRSEMNTAVAILACMAAGVTAVPLSYRYGEIHSRRIIDAVGLTHMLTDDCGKLEISEGEMQPEPEDLEGVAVIMCTSGTTGIPKGAMITEKNILSNLSDIQQYFPLTAADRLLIARPLYHCAVLTGEFLIGLLQGASILFSSVGFNPMETVRHIRRENITVLGGTPTLFHHLGPLYRRDAGNHSLKTLVVSGECLTDTVAQEISSCFPGARIFSVYGLTEASPRVASLNPAEFRQYPTSVGHPLASVQAKVVDMEGRKQPCGTCGELLIQGPNVMKGYYANPQATQKAVRDGWLHTGDMAVMDQEGRIFIKGRRDNMIIRAGMNIYPQEVENALMTDGRVREVLAFGEEGKPSGERLCIKVVPADQTVTKAGIMEICREKLPRYAWPDRIEIAEALERNASGKLIRRQ